MILNFIATSKSWKIKVKFSRLTFRIALLCCLFKIMLLPYLKVLEAIMQIEDSQIYKLT